MVFANDLLTVSVLLFYFLNDGSSSVAILDFGRYEFIIINIDFLFVINIPDMLGRIHPSLWSLGSQEATKILACMSAVSLGYFKLIRRVFEKVCRKMF